MNREPLDAWLERAAAGARDVLADYAAARFFAVCDLPPYLRKGAKAEDVPYETSMRSGGFNSIQDLASQIITHSNEPEIVKLAEEIYAEATKRMGTLAGAATGTVPSSRD